MKIRARSLHDVLCDLPDLEPIGTELSEDVFISVLGFEERALSVPRSLAANGYKCRTALYVQYQNSLVDNSVNQGSLMSSLISMATVPPMSIFDTEATQRLRGHILPLSSASGRELNVCFDMSAASTALVIDVVRALLDLPVCLRICYAEAAIYYPTEQEYNAEPAKWLTSDGLRNEIGIKSVFTSPEYPGQHYDPLPHALMIAPGFNPARTKGMLAAVDESLLTSLTDAVIWLLGVPHLSDNQWRCQALVEINEIEPSAPRFEVSTFDYKDMIRVLERVREDKWMTHNITLALLGSKLQAVGAALFCQMHPEVRVMVSSPLYYMPARYSSGTRDLWQIRFGSTSLIRNSLLSCGELQIVEA